MMKNVKEINDYIEDMGYEEVVIFSNPDYASAFIGVDMVSNRAVYDYEKMVEHLVEKDGMEEIEAVEFIDYNTIGALNPSDNGYPIIVNLIN